MENLLPLKRVAITPREKMTGEKDWLFIILNRVMGTRFFLERGVIGDVSIH